MAKQTLFSILLRSPWWLSAVVAIVLFTATRQFLPGIVALAVALPFLALAAYSGWRQLREMSVTDAAGMLGKLRAMSWENFSLVIGEAFRRDGYSVIEGITGAVDFELHKNGRVTVVSCKRWKVAHTGIEPLRELYAARRAREAHESIYVAAGDFTPNARGYAAEKRITLLHGAALAHMTERIASRRAPWWSR